MCEIFKIVQKTVQYILNIGSLRKIVIADKHIAFHKTHGDDPSLRISDKKITML